MKRCLCISAGILLLLQLVLPMPVKAESNKTVLLIYRISKGGQAADVYHLINDIIMKGASCSSVNMMMYDKGLIRSYTHVIIVNLDDTVPVNESLQNDLLHYTGRILRLDSLDNDYKVDAARKAAISGFLEATSVQAGLYVKLDYVYPISDFNLISEMGGYLKERNVPFIFVAMPFYLNGDSQAAKQYGKLLRYLTDCGGTAIIHCPVFSQIAQDDMPMPDEVIEKLDTAIDNLAALGIFPTAIQMPDAYLSRTDYGDVFGCFSHYFAVEGSGADVYTVSENTAFPALQDPLTQYMTLNESVYEIRLPSSMMGKAYEPQSAERESFLTKAAFLANSMHENYAVSLPSWLNIAQFKDIIDGMKNKRIPFLNFNHGIQNVNLGENNISNRYGTVTYNGRLNVTSAEVGQSAAPEDAGDTSDVRGFLNRGSLFIVLFSSIAIFILIRAFWVGKIEDKKKFIRRR